MIQSTKRDLKKVDSVWFDDGNLIVIAGPKVFRLYQGLLARRSPVFRDTLSIPQPDTPAVLDVVTDTLGLDCTGCAIIQFTDKPQEVEWLLSAFIHDRDLVQYSTNTSVLVGILRLATKYKVNYLRRWAVLCLEKLYPVSGDKADEEGLPKMQILQRGEKDKFEWMNGMLPLITLAVEVGVSWVLPHVLWQLQTTSLGDILYHPEWAAFPEERKILLLLGREGIIRGDCQGRLRKFATEPFPTLQERNGLPAQAAKQFPTLQERNGLPAQAEMMELRKAFHAEVGTDA